MIHTLKLVTFLSLLSTGICTTLSAHPDVFFQDSDTYNGAYLKHEIDDNNNIRFILTSPVSNIILPNNLYNLDRLKNYIIMTHVFSNYELRAEFINMLNMSFESRFRAEKFLQELQKVLAGFSRS